MNKLRHRINVDTGFHTKAEHVLLDPLTSWHPGSAIDFHLFANYILLELSELQKHIPKYHRLFSYFSGKNWQDHFVHKNLYLEGWYLSEIYSPVNCSVSVSPLHFSMKRITAEEEGRVHGLSLLLFLQLLVSL